MLALLAGALFLPAARLRALATLQQDEQGRLIVPVRLAGRGPFRFVLDTAAGQSVISSWLAGELRLTAAAGPERALHGTTGSTLVSARRGLHLEFDGVRRDDVELLPVDPAALAGADGLLGVDLLAGHRVHLDFAGGTVRVDPSPSLRLTEGLRRLRGVRWHDGLAWLPCRVGASRCLALLDTGAQRSIGNLALAEALQREGAAADAAGPLVLTGIDGRQAVARSVAAPALRVGAHRLPAAALWCAPLPVFARAGLAQRPALLLGMDRLAPLRRLLLDLHGRAVWLPA